MSYPARAEGLVNRIFSILGSMQLRCKTNLRNTKTDNMQKYSKCRQCAYRKKKAKTKAIEIWTEKICTKEMDESAWLWILQAVNICPRWKMVSPGIFARKLDAKNTQRSTYTGQKARLNFNNKERNLLLF